MGGTGFNREVPIWFAAGRAQGLQEEFSERRGNHVVKDWIHSWADVEKCVGQHVEVMVKRVEKPAREDQYDSYDLKLK